MVEQTRFVAFFRAEYARLCRIAARLVRDRGLAEQIVGESLLSVWRRRQEVDWNRPFPYACRAVVEECKDAIETAGKGRDPRERVGYDDIPRQRTTTWAFEARLTGSALLDDLLKRLPMQQRAVVVLRVYEDMPEADVAEVLGLSVGTVRGHYSRALGTLRTAMAGVHS